MASSTIVQVQPLREKEKYHVFIAHSRKQSDFVKGTLSTKLEDYHIKCCDVEKDFVPGVSVVNNIVNCMNKSRKVVLIISKDFMESDWTNFEIGEAIQKEGKARKSTIIPILWRDRSIGNWSICNLPSYIRRHNNILIWEEKKSELFWIKLRDAINDESIRDTVDVGNVAEGLAWQYYYGFLKLVLPVCTVLGLVERVKHKEGFDFPKEAKKYQRFEDIKDLRLLPKMMIIMPQRDDFFPYNLPNENENVQLVCQIAHNISRAGNIKRSYSLPLYSVKSPPNNKEVLIIAEFPPPLLCLYEMQQNKLAHFSETARLQQAQKFEEKLMDILEMDKDCQATYCFLQLEESDNLAAKMSERAFQELEIMEAARQTRK